MPNPNKQKGDRAERSVLRYLHMAGFPRAWKTRAGWDDDRGDIVIPHPSDSSRSVAVQVKDVAKPVWSKWHEQVAAQVRNAGAEFGVIVHKRRGISDPSQWHVVMTGAQFAEILTMVGYSEAIHEVADAEVAS